MKLFNIIFFTLIALGFTFGFVIPMLVSSNHTELVILGVTIILGMIYFAGFKIVKYCTKRKI